MWAEEKVREILQRLRISEETFRKIFTDVTRVFIEEKYSHYLESWEDFYSGVFKEKTQTEKKAVLLTLAMYVVTATEMLYKIVMESKLEYFERLKNSYPEHEIYAALFHTILAGGMMSLADPVTLTNRLFTYLKNYERQAKKVEEKVKGKEELDRSRKILEYVYVGAMFSVFFLFEEYEEKSKKETKEGLTLQ